MTAYLGMSNHNVKIWFLLCRLGYTIEKVPESKFHLSKEMSHKVALLIASLWNYAVNSLKSLCSGNDWMSYLKVFVLTCISAPHIVYIYILHDWILLIYDSVFV